MTFREEKRDLFAVEGDRYLAHCIGGDYALGAGIALEFAKRYHMREKLNEKWPIPYLDSSKISDTIDDSRDYNYYVGRALLVEDVFNLVTKKFSFGKPTYEMLMTCLYDMEWHCRNLGIKKLAMPRIGCGLDRLKWERVREMIKEVFADDDIDILVCYQKGE